MRLILEEFTELHAKEICNWKYDGEYYSANLYSSKIIALEVRSLNERVIKCCKRAGFIVKEIYKKDNPIGYGEFIRMEFIC
ncbi:hypothetical protein [Clostridium beijerinckii]|uniref:hypothetical protein n=1 Tax=Clostridium beijerinckii TaxID=1520 RepID=UPI00098CA80E|nr:hypothetical protein [Clostridium beijerinckii]MBA8933538.1 hypothetical protein [Clostridium beijerinckii]NRU37737.1 hypothetical protein [Clostridium beijerinckii]NSA98985.1 hypothetical protein [Clostridium beijerinckii]OOM58497.1 hypothetical protein CLOBI_38910 [Clostridium beijerinckii]OOM72570.1 hypothetical protein CLBEIC_05790 [Clostridium beijerinckii]